MRSADLLVPPGSRLVHIGPPKTGTTAIQGALWRGRQAMAEHGVVYPGRARQHTKAARAVLGLTGPKGDPPVDPRGWDRLLREVAAAGGRRVIVSSEAFSGADDDAAGQIASALGGSLTHVVVTLRPLVRILPSAWHESVRHGQSRSYSQWLQHVLAPTPARGTANFWRRHSHGLLVERWVSVVGAGNVTVVVVDETDRTMLLRVFEQLVGLPTGLLGLDPKSNPSLGFGEIELVRHLNREFRRRGWSPERHRALVRKGMTRHLQASDRPALGDQRIRTPPWAAERAADLGSAAAERIAALGVQVAGDLSALGALPAGHEPAAGPQPVLHAEAAMQAVVGAILAATPRSPRAVRANGGRGSTRPSTRRTLVAVRGLLRLRS